MEPKPSKTKKAKAAKEPKPKKEKAPKEPQVVFAFRLTEAIGNKLVGLIYAGVGIFIGSTQPQRQGVVVFDTEKDKENQPGNDGRGAQALAFDQRGELTGGADRQHPQRGE